MFKQLLAGAATAAVVAAQMTDMVVPSEDPTVPSSAPSISTNTTTNTSIMFTNPQSGSTWSLSESEMITWTEPVATDPQNVSLLIVNVHNASMLPAYPTPLALNIFSNQTNFSLAGVSIPAGDGYVMLMTDIYNSSNIYAQGGVFSVSTSDSEGPIGSGFSIASSTIITAGGPAGGYFTAADAAMTSAPARMVRHRRGMDAESKKDH